MLAVTTFGRFLAVQKYAKNGLVVIAVHSPEFSHEKEVEQVKTYVQENHIPYAVPIDNEFRNWRRYKNRYWPPFRPSPRLLKEIVYEKDLS